MGKGIGERERFPDLLTQEKKEQFILQARGQRLLQPAPSLAQETVSDSKSSLSSLESRYLGQLHLICR